jgi:cell division GTPase FtsZ
MKEKDSTKAQSGVSMETRASTAEFLKLPSPPVKLTVFACGGIGANVADDMIRRLSTKDHQHLKIGVCESNWSVLRDHFIVDEDPDNPKSVKLFEWFRSEQLKVFPLGSDGFGAGGDPALGGKMLAKSMDEIKAFMEGTTIALLIGGGGGGTSGVMPILAQWLQGEGIPSFSILSLPRFNEGGKRIQRARQIEKTLLGIHPTILVDNEKIEPSDDSSGDVYWKINSSCIFPNIEFLRSLIEDVGNIIDIDLKDLIHAFTIGNRVLLGTFDASSGIQDVEESLFENRYFDNSILGEARIILWWINGEWSTKEKDQILAFARKRMKVANDEEIEIKWGIRQVADGGPKTISFFALAPVSEPSQPSTQGGEQQQVASEVSPAPPEAPTPDMQPVEPIPPPPVRGTFPIKGMVKGEQKTLLVTSDLATEWSSLSAKQYPTAEDAQKKKEVLRRIGEQQEDGVTFDSHASLARAAIEIPTAIS